jgi:hypothetical protein
MAKPRIAGGTVTTTRDEQQSIISQAGIGTSGAVLTLLLAVVVGAPLPAAAAPPIEISTCNGAVVPPHRAAVLSADVQCGSHCDLDPSSPCDATGTCLSDPSDTCSGDSIKLGRGSVLRFAGHTLRGAYNSNAISCGDSKPGGSCSVVGPGIVESTKGSAVASASMSIRVRDLTMNGSYGALESLRSVFVRNSTFGSWDGDIGARTIHLVDVTSVGHDGGLFASRSVFFRRLSTGSGIHADLRIVGRHLTWTSTPCPALDAPIVRISDVDPPSCTP